MNGDTPISIVVCTRNRHRKLDKCIESILAADLSGVMDIIIFDQSDEPSNNDFSKSSKRLRYFWEPGRGHAKARNRAICRVQGAIIGFTDDDCIVTSEWVKLAAEYFRLTPDAWGVFGRVSAACDRSADGIAYYTESSTFGDVFYATKSGELICNALFDKPSSGEFNSPCVPFANIGQGNNMFLRRAAFEAHGLFHERLGAGTWLKSAEDTEYQYRLLRRGCLLVYRPEVQVYHDNWITIEENNQLQRGYLTGVVATFARYVLACDEFAYRYLLHRWREEWEDIVATSSGQPAGRLLLRWLERRSAIMVGMVGGVLLSIAKEPPCL